MRRHFLDRFRDALTFNVLVFFLGVVFLMGGSARSDVQSLAILRPVAALAICFGLWELTPAHIRTHRYLFVFAGAVLVLVAIHLIPLPPSVWAALPGRELAAEIDKVATLGEVWRPISLVPSATWNALYSLLVPLAVLVLAVQVNRHQLFQLQLVLIIIGLFSGFLGLLQSIGPAEGPLYFYRITNNGSAVGLFANRNHQAVLLASLFPMLAVYASTGLKSVEQARIRLMIAVGAGVVLIPLLLVTGSRAGLIAGLVGLSSVALLYRRPRFEKPAKRKLHKIAPRYVYGALLVLGLGALTILMSRAEALSRLITIDPTQDVRLAYWTPIFAMIGKYFPVGSGVGSFVEVFRLDEPLNLIETSYANHAHNDLLEILMTGGLPALLLLLAAAAAWGWASIRLFSKQRSGGRGLVFGRQGAVLIFILAFASIVDYPLRVPSLASLLVVAAMWMATAFSGQEVRDDPASRIGERA